MNATHKALIYGMVTTSAADTTMTDAELMTIENVVALYPVFSDCERSHLSNIANECIALLDDEDGIENIIAVMRDTLPETLYETAYALCVDVAAADLIAKQEELRFLEILRHRLDIDRLIAAGIERGARARYAQS